MCVSLSHCERVGVCVYLCTNSLCWHARHTRHAVLLLIPVSALYTNTHTHTHIHVDCCATDKTAAALAIDVAVAVVVNVALQQQQQHHHILRRYSGVAAVAVA